MRTARMIWWWRENRIAVYEGAAGLGWAVWMGYLAAEFFV